jgi:YHS domain-containing protein
MRTILYLLVLIIVLPALLRFTLSLVKALLEPGGRAEVRKRSAGVPLQGEQKRDPVCGTYVSTAPSVKLTGAGEVVHFCSEECRAKYKG